MNLFKNIIKKPFEWFISIIGYCIFSCLYLQIVITPAIILSLLGLVAFNFLEYDSVINLLYGLAVVGFIIGIIWAEHIRKKYSVFGFLGYISGHPEIDGWQNHKKGIVFRKGNLTRISSGRNDFV